MSTNSALEELHDYEKHGYFQQVGATAHMSYETKKNFRDYYDGLVIIVS